MTSHHRDFEVSLCSSGPEGLGSRLARRSTVMYANVTPSACKILRGCNVLQVPIQNYTSEGMKAGEPSPRGGSKLGWHVSGPSLGMSLRPSAIAHCVALVRR